MAELAKKIDTSLIEALKAKEERKVSALRMIKAAIKEKEIDKRAALEDEEVIKILQSQVKSHKDSLDQFQKAGRTDLVEQETAELKVIKQFLPPELDAATLEKIVKEAVEESGAQTMADLGKVMPLAIKKAQGQASGDEIRNLVQKLLS